MTISLFFTTITLNQTFKGGKKIPGTVKVKIYGSSVHPALKEEVKRLLEAAIKKQNRNKLIDYDQMAGYIAEGIEKFIEAQNLERA